MPPAICDGLSFVSTETQGSLETTAEYCGPTNQNAVLLSESIPTVIARLQLVGGQPLDLAGLLPDTLYPGWHTLKLVSEERGDVLAAMPVFVEPDQECPDPPTTGDEDGDELADSCDLDPLDGPAADFDSDSVPNADDACPTVADPGQSDTDSDYTGDACDADSGQDPLAGYRTMTDDHQAPIVNPILPEPNDDGWYRDDVDITWEVSDPLPSSGPPTIPPSVRATTEGQNVAYTSEQSCDPAGNCQSGVVHLSIDKLAPTATIEHPTTAREFQEMATSAPNSCADPGGAGLKSCIATVTPEGIQVGNGEAMPTSRSGIHTLTVVALDRAGNATTSTADYKVIPQPEELVRDLDVVAGDRAVALVWKAPADAGDVIESYEVVVSSGRTISTTETNLLVGDLTNGTTYSFEVIAHTDVGDFAVTAQSVMPTGARMKLGPLRSSRPPRRPSGSARQSGSRAEICGLRMCVSRGRVRRQRSSPGRPRRSPLSLPPGAGSGDPPSPVRVVRRSRPRPLS